MTRNFTGMDFVAKARGQQPGKGVEPEPSR